MWFYFLGVVLSGDGTFTRATRAGRTLPSASIAYGPEAGGDRSSIERATPMKLLMLKRRYICVFAMLMMTSACGTPDADDSDVAEQVSLSVEQTDEDSTATASWRLEVADEDPVLASQLPSDAVLGPSWGFAEIVRGEAEPAEVDEQCGTQIPERPAWLLVRFQVDSEALGQPHREGTLDIRMQRGSRAVLDDLMKYEEDSNCLGSNLPDGVTMTNITEALPAGVFKAFRIDLPDSVDEPEAEFTVVYAQNEGTAFQVTVSALQSVGHPDSLDTTSEALRVVSEIMST